MNYASILITLSLSPTESEYQKPLCGKLTSLLQAKVCTISKSKHPSFVEAYLEMLCINFGEDQTSEVVQIGC